MRAVNLIPPEQRRAARGVASLSGPTRALFAALALAAVLAVAYAVVAGGVSDRRETLARVEADVRETQARGAALAPYGRVAELRQRSVATVLGLAGTRFDWHGLLAEIARRLPADVSLATLEGTRADTPPAVAGTPTETAGAAPSAPPSIELAGCAESHRGVARTIDALRAMPRVADVLLTSSDAGEGAGAAGGCARPDQFRMTLVLTAAATTPGSVP